jgi:hypothetical protein
VQALPQPTAARRHRRPVTSPPSGFPGRSGRSRTQRLRQRAFTSWPQGFRAVPAKPRDRLELDISRLWWTPQHPNACAGPRSAILRASRNSASLPCLRVLPALNQDRASSGSRPCPQGELGGHRAASGGRPREWTPVASRRHGRRTSRSRTTRWRLGHGLASGPRARGGGRPLELGPPRRRRWRCTKVAHTYGLSA